MSDQYIIASMFTTIGVVIACFEANYLIGRIRGYVRNRRTS